MPTLTEIPLRFALDVQSRTAAVPIGSASDVVIYRGNPFVVQVAEFNGTPSADTLVDVSNITEASLVIRKNNRRGDVILEKVLAAEDITTTLTYNNWAAGSGQQFAFSLSDTDTNQEVGSDGSLDIYAAVSVVTASGEITLGYFTGTITEDGIGSAEVPPDADYTSYSKAQVNALIGGQIGGIISFADILGTISIEQLPPGSIATLDPIDEDALYFFDNDDFLPRLISATEAVAFISGTITFNDLGGTLSLDQLPSGTAATVSTIDEDAFFFYNNATGLPELLSIADTITALGGIGGGSSYTNVTQPTDDIIIFEDTFAGQIEFAVSNPSSDVEAISVVAASADGNTIDIEALSSTYTGYDPSIAIPGDVGLWSGGGSGRMYITSGGPILFSNDNLVTERARFNNGLSVGSTTDPGSGNILLAGLTASRFVQTDGSKILVSKTAAEMRTDLALVIGTNVQAWDAELDTWATKTPYAGTLTITTGKTFDVTNNLTLSGTDGSTLAIGAGGTLGTAAYTATGAYQPIDSDLTTIAGLTATTDNFIVSVSSAWASRTPSQVRTTLGLVIGTNVQAWDADLDTIAGLTATTDNFIVSVSSAWASRTPAQVLSTLAAVGTTFQPLDGDLTTIAGLTATTDNFIVSVSSAWASRTPAQVLATLAAVGTTFQPLDGDLTTIAGLTATTDNFIVSVSSAWASRTPSQVRTTLGLVIGTNVQAWDADLDTLAGLTATTDNFIVSVSSAWASRTPAQVLTTLAAVGTTFQPLDGDLTTIAGLTATTDNFIVSVSSAWASRTPSQVRTTLGIVNTRIRTFGFTVDGAGAAITTGKVKGYFTCPFAGTITGFNIAADTGTCTIQTWRVATGTAVPTVSNSISSSGVQLSSGTAVHSTTVSDFTSTTVTANDIFAFNIGTIASATELTFSLEITTSA